MGWWKSPKSTSSPSSASPARSSRRDFTSLWTTAKRDSNNHLQQPRLTRQRKLRHPSDIDVWNLAGDLTRKGESANSTPVSRSSSNLDDDLLTRRSASSSTLLPHPLPLPEGLSGRFPLPSPRALGPSSARIGEDATGELLAVLAEPVRERLPQRISVGGSRLPYATMPKNPERFDVPAAVPTSGRRRTMFQYSSTTKDDFRLDIPTRSAPTSAICSPVLSPRRPSSGEYVPSGYLTPQAPQACSASDFSDFATGFHSQMPVEKLPVSPERSPLHSPTARSPGLRSRNPSAPSSPLHPRMFPENPATPSHGNFNVHPLPLPPGAPGQIQPPFSHPSPTKGDASSMGSQWQKRELIGCGTFGSVYKAINRHTGAFCAMKEVNIVPDDPKSIECIKQLQQEIRFLSQLEHQNIVKYYGSEIIGDHLYIYLEYVYPGSINKYVRDHCGAITESVVRNFSRHILMGLSYLHSKGAIHRDIKGANLLVDSNGVVKLADFGMAKHLAEAQCAYSMSGTPYWMAPEVLQASMNKDTGYNSAVDIWSLGCTIIEMYTGKHPWNGLPYAAAMFKVLHNSPDIPETLSPEGKEFLQLCFRRNPAERPSASELLEHHFITNSHHHDLHSSVQAFSEIKLSDDSHLPNNCNLFKNDTMMKGKNVNGETARVHLHYVGHFASSSAAQTHLDNANIATSRHSPRSTLEVVPSFSPPHMIQGASCLRGHLPNGTDIPQLGAGKTLNHLFAGWHRKEV